MTIRRKSIACSITEAINIHSEYEIINAFPLQYDCTNVYQCYFIRTLPVLLDLVSGMLDNRSLARTPEDKGSEDEVNHCNSRSARVKDG